MVRGCSKNGATTCPQLLDLIPKEKQWGLKRGEDHVGSSEERKLELRLGPPGHEDWSNPKDSNTKKSDDESLLSLGYLSSSQKGYVWFHQKQQQQQQGEAPSFLQSSSQMLVTVMGKESSQPCCSKVVPELQQQNNSRLPGKEAFSLPISLPPPANTAVPYSSQKRTAPGPVVGWPPIRSFRKNLASASSSKQPLDTQNENPNKVASENPAETSKKGLFVKINMDGIPIGRKVDLKAYGSYEKLSAAVDELFQGFLAAQSDCAGGMMNKQEEEKRITGVLGGSGDYTLIYEDNEGDSMLVGDVPWHMFVSTVKRLRVLKSSEVSALSLGSSRQTRAN